MGHGLSHAPRLIEGFNTTLQGAVHRDSSRCSYAYAHTFAGTEVMELASWKRSPANHGTGADATAGVNRSDSCRPPVPVPEHRSSKIKSVSLDLIGLYARVCTKLFVF
jgi:hypothetical protein